METIKIILKKEVTEEREVPQCFRSFTSYYKICGERYMIVNPICIAALPVSTLKEYEIKEASPITIEDFNFQYEEALKNLNKYKICNQ